VPEARRAALRLLGRLAPRAIAGTRIVVLEPSCWSMLVDDVPKLIPDDPRAAWVAEATATFERALLDLDPTQAPADAEGVVRHAHCHSRSIGSGGELEALLTVLGVESTDTGAGCCGMAGAFGYLHPEVSRAVASDRFLPALDERTLVATGTSCRAQARELSGVDAIHPAELAAARLT
jgi:Fe-S oxidoreductase